jgi:hypothetical protein
MSLTKNIYGFLIVVDYMAMMQIKLIDVKLSKQSLQLLVVPRLFLRKLNFGHKC